MKVKVYSHGEVDPNESFHTVGWSTIAVLVATVVATVVFLCFYALGGRVYPVGIPFARSSSSVIAAACHNPDGGKLRLEGVMWGDVGVSDEKGVRHLAFGNAEVEPPEKGVLYA